MSTTSTDLALPRLLRGTGGRAMAQLDRHLEVHGPLPALGARAVIDAVDSAELRGRGGASFPTAQKLRAVRAARGRPVVVANGCESEPLSAKDALLLEQAPHLVLDGALLAARAVGTDEVILALEEPNAAARASVEQALLQRRQSTHDGVDVEVRMTPQRFLSGQETALVSHLGGGPATPTFVPPRPAQRGVQRRPTLIQNVETLANVALIARYGPQWFRSLGTPTETGSALVTVLGAIGAPGVYEIELGTPLRALLAAAGGLDATLGGLLIGGYFGSWLAAGLVGELELSNASLARHGAGLGCRVLVALPVHACPVAETVRVAIYLANETARQCGPCVHASAAIARALHGIAQGSAPQSAFGDLDRWTAELPGRGACHLPNGLAHFVASALETFAAAFEDHARRGPCDACAAAPLLVVPRAAPAR